MAVDITNPGTAAAALQAALLDAAFTTPLVANELLVGRGASAQPGSLAIGTSGQFLISNGATLDPSFQTLTFGMLPVQAKYRTFDFTFAGKPGTGEIRNISVPVAVTIPASLTGTTVYDSTLATASAAFVLNQITSGNTITAIGTITVTTTNHFSKTLSGAGGVLAAGDTLQLVAPTQDATLANVAITVFGTS